MEKTKYSTMAEEIELETERLNLRQWLADDYVQFSESSADPEGMGYLPGVLSESRSCSFVKKSESLKYKTSMNQEVYIC